MDLFGPEVNWFESVILPVAGLVAVAVVWRRGYLSRSALAGVPRRDAGLELMDMMVGLVLMLLGMAAAQQVMTRMGLWIDGDSGELAEVTPGQYMKQALVGQGLVQLPVVLYVVWRCGAWPGRFREFGLWPRRPVREVFIAVAALVAVLPMAMSLSVMMVYIGQWLGRPAPAIGHELLSVLQEPAVGWVRAGLLASALVVAPLLEEVIFRGLVQTAFLSVTGRGRRWWVVIIAAGIFTGMHAGQPWQVLPSLFVLGVVLGWLYERTGSLWPSMLVHAGFNAVNVALAV